MLTRSACGLLLVVLAGCAPGSWTTLYSLPSPDGKARVLVEERNCFGDCGVQVVVESGWRKRRIAEGNDCHVAFAHAAWSGSVVSVYVNGTYCGIIAAAYDTHSEKLVDFQLTEVWLGKDIVSSYRITDWELQRHVGDVWRWVQDKDFPRASGEFGRRHRRE